MEISDTPDGMASAPPPLSARERKERKEKAAAWILRDTLSLLRLVLVVHYETEQFVATELEAEIEALFGRYCRRPGGLKVRDCRRFLVKAACQLAHEYQRYLVETNQRELSRKLLDLLERGPAEVARDFEKSLDLFEHRPFDNPPEL